MSDPLSAIVAVVLSFSHAATTRDVAALERTLAPTAVQHVRVGDSWSALPTPAYLSMMREGKIGGEVVTVEVHEVSRAGGVAQVHATRSTASYRFEDHLTLTATGSQWQIVSVAVVATPTKK